MVLPCRMLLVGVSAAAAAPLTSMMLAAGVLGLLLVGSCSAVEVGMMYEGWQAPAFWGRAPNNVT